MNSRLALFTLALGAVLAAVPVTAAQASTQTVSAQDRQYLQKSAAGDIFEIQGGQMAERKGQSQVIRSLGARLVADHTKSLSDARDLAKKLGITLPSKPDAQMQAILGQYSAASGAAFDTVFAKEEVSDHHQDISDATTEVTQGSNTEVKQNAQQDLPVLRTHLALAQQALAAVTGRSPSSVQAGSGGTAGQVPLLAPGWLALLAGAGAMLVAISARRLRRKGSA